MNLTVYIAIQHIYVDMVVEICKETNTDLRYFSSLGLVHNKEHNSKFFCHLLIFDTGI
jgi:hypothetical protein